MRGFIILAAVLSFAGFLIPAQANSQANQPKADLPLAGWSSLGELRCQKLSEALVDSLNVRCVGRLPYGACRTIAVQGNYLFAGVGRGLWIFDVSAPTDPVATAILATADRVLDVFVSANYAYLAEGLTGLQIINIANPASPFEEGSCETGDMATGLFVSEDYAYVVSGSDGLHIIDVSNSSGPEEVGYLDTRGLAINVFVSGSYAYVADGDSGLGIFDVSNPNSPEEVAYYLTGDRATDVFVRGDYAYIANGNDGLLIVDISNPHNPYQIGSENTPGYANALTVDGSYAYLASGYYLQIIDISSPWSPSTIGSFYAGGSMITLDVHDNKAYLGVRYGGLRIVDVSDPQNPEEIGFYHTEPFWFRAVFSTSGYAYVASSYYDAIRIIDVSNLQKPFETALYLTEGYAQDVFVDGIYAYVADGSEGLRIINISDPRNPHEAGFYNTPGSATAVFVDGIYAYVADGSEGLRIINISDPRNPHEAGFYNTPGSATAVFVDGIYAYVADGSEGLRIINVSNPSNPYEEGAFAEGWVENVFVRDTCAYTVDWSNLSIIDVSDPTQPSLLGLCEADSSQAVFVNEGYAFLACGFGGMRVFDISDPTNPFEVGYYASGGIVWDVFADGGYVYATDSYEGFYIFEFTPPGPELSCSNSTPVLCRGKHVYFTVTYTNNTGAPINTMVTFSGYSGYNCDPDSSLIQIPRNRTIPTGTTTYYYYLKVPTSVQPGQYSLSVGFTYEGTDYFCCMNADITQCSPWKEGDNTEWSLVELSHPEAEVPLPAITSLAQNYPNPFNATTGISYTLAQPGQAKLAIYNISGQLIETLVEGYEDIGEYSVIWDASEICSGLYFYKLTAGEFSQVKKMMLLK